MGKQRGQENAAHGLRQCAHAGGDRGRADGGHAGVALVTAWLWIGVAPPLRSVLGGLVSLAGLLVVTLRGRATKTDSAPRATVLPLPAAD